MNSCATQGAVSTTDLRRLMAGREAERASRSIAVGDRAGSATESGIRTVL